MDKTQHAPQRAESCKSCVYLEPDQARGFVCCRYPPTVTILQLIEMDPMTGKPGKPGTRMHRQSSRPPVALSEWCGEYIPAES